jgi:hypothetical protein
MSATIPNYDQYAALVIQRAEEIYREGRSVFTFGPAPFDITIDYVHELTGKTWALRFSSRFGPAAIVGHVERLSKATTVEAVAFMLAYCQAADDIIGAEHTPAGDA